MKETSKSPETLWRKAAEVVPPGVLPNLHDAFVNLSERSDCPLELDTEISGLNDEPTRAAHGVDGVAGITIEGLIGCRIEAIAKIGAEKRLRLLAEASWAADSLKPLITGAKLLLEVLEDPKWVTIGSIYKEDFANPIKMDEVASKELIERLVTMRPYKFEEPEVDCKGIDGLPTVFPTSHTMVLREITSFNPTTFRLTDHYGNRFPVVAVVDLHGLRRAIAVGDDGWWGVKETDHHSYISISIPLGSEREDGRLRLTTADRICIGALLRATAPK